MKAIYFYEGNYKYQLGLEYKHQLPFKPPSTSFQMAMDLLVIKHDYFTLSASGLLAIKAGYAWDGASGPTFDTSNAMRASLVHDVGYQMIGEKLLPGDFRLGFDEEFLSILIEDGMSDFRAHAWFLAVRAAGGVAARRGARRLRKAPEVWNPTTTGEVRFGRV